MKIALDGRFVVLSRAHPSCCGVKRTEEDSRVVIASADAAMAGTLEADLVLLKPISFSQLRDLTKRFMRSSDSTK